MFLIFICYWLKEFKSLKVFSWPVKVTVNASIVDYIQNNYYFINSINVI